MSCNLRLFLQAFLLLLQVPVNQMKNEDQLRSMIERVQEEKVYEGIKAAAKVETKTISYEDFGKLFEQK